MPIWKAGRSNTGFLGLQKADKKDNQKIRNRTTTDAEARMNNAIFSGF